MTTAPDRRAARIHSSVSLPGLTLPGLTLPGLTLPSLTLPSLALVSLTLIGCSDAARHAPLAAGPVGPPLPVHVAPDDLPPAIDLTQARVGVRSIVEPTIIDTRTFEPAIQDLGPFQGVPMSTSAPQRGDDEGHEEGPAVPAGPATDIVPGGMLAASRANPGPLFPGIEQTPWSPPDPALAVGPDHIVETVNMSIAFYTKDGELQFLQRLDSTGSPGFFEELGAGDFTFDPKCMYDHETGRFIVVALEKYNTTNEAWITMAVSDDSDPNGVWFKYRTWAVVEVGSGGYWVDYPGFGFDGDAYYVTGNLFHLYGGGGGFAGVLFRSFDKLSMINGAPAEFVDFRDPDSGSVQVAQHFGAAPAPYFVSRASSSSIKVQALLDPLGSPVLETTTVAVASYEGPGDASNPGGAIDTLDGRIMNVHWRDGNLYAAHAVAAGSFSKARWYHFDTGLWPVSGAVSLVQSGDVSISNGWVFFPAIYSNRYGDVGLVVGQCRATENPSVQVTGRRANDPAGTMGELTELVVGTAGANGRWGDYFDIAVDPVDDTRFWIVGEYASAGVGWSTWLGSFSISCPGDVDGSGSVDVADLLAVLAAWGDCPGCPEDIDGDDQVTVTDLLEVLAGWGTCEG